MTRYSCVGRAAQLLREGGRGAADAGESKLELGVLFSLSLFRPIGLSMRPVALRRPAYSGDRFACPLFARCHCDAGECFAGYVCPSHRLGASQPAVALQRSCIGCQRLSRYADRTMQVASHPQQHRWLAEAAHSASASCWDHQSACGLPDGWPSPLAE